MMLVVGIYLQPLSGPMNDALACLGRGMPMWSYMPYLFVRPDFLGLTRLELEAKDMHTPTPTHHKMS